MLLDTHVLLWLLGDSPRLGASARAAIERAPAVHVSAASLWEVSIKRALGKLSVPEDLPDRVEAAGLAWLDVSAEHAWRSQHVELPHRDPFDRLLLALAAHQRLPFLTADRVLLEAAPEGVDCVEATA